MGDAGRFQYDGERGREVSLPLGGIGTGSIGLSGGGRLVDWEIFNRPNKGVTNGISHFAVRAEQAGTVIDARILNGPYLGNRTGDFPADPSRNFGFGARRDSLAGMPHFRSNTFEGRFPTADLVFRDERFPGDVGLLAFNPFIPLADRDSSIPVAMFEITFANPTDAPIDYTAVGVIGHGIRAPTRAVSGRTDGHTWVRIATDEEAPDAPEYAELILATDAVETSRQTHLYRGHWFDALEVYWKDLATPGPFAEREYPTPDYAGGMGRNRDSSLLSAHVKVPPGERRTVRFAIAWYAPNFRKYWVSPVWHFRQASGASGQWRNWYGTEWPGADAIAAEVLTRWDDLRDRTTAFREALYGSTLPGPVLDAAAANLSTLKSPTSLRLEDGTFYGWEGCHPTAGSCEGSCTHVWNYAQALPYLFPGLERSMREVDYRYNQDEAGAMSFRLSLPLGSTNSTERPCADGQFGDVMKLYRDWRLSGDTTWLHELWPYVKRSIEYAWSPDNPDRWDPDKTGVLWGRQHHTLDMELFGPNSWLTGFYLGALDAGARMADAVGDAGFAAELRAIHERGRTWVCEHLFNGEFFVQRIDLSDRAVLRPFVASERAVGVLGEGVEALYWSAEHQELKYQAGEGCLIDQILAQWHGRLYGLDDVFDRDQVVSALDAIFRHNHIGRLEDIYNPCRVFGLDDESGTIVASWPDASRKPAVPVPYAQETMHGMEYAFAQLLMAYGSLDRGVTVTRAVRDRYDGAKRNPWNEIECGSNYARSMASWGAVVILAGFEADTAAGRIAFRPTLRDGDHSRAFWSGPPAYGTFALRTGLITLEVIAGAMAICRLGLPTGATGPTDVRVDGRSIPFECVGGDIAFEPVTLSAGVRIEIEGSGITLDGLVEVATLHGEERATEAMVATT
jgi:non-lysosomal glucosylceramidase